MLIEGRRREWKRGEVFKSRVMLTCVLRAQVKKIKIELSNKFYIEKITFEIF